MDSDVIFSYTTKVKMYEQLIPSLSHRNSPFTSIWKASQMCILVHVCSYFKHYGTTFVLKNVGETILYNNIFNKSGYRNMWFTFARNI